MATALALPLGTVGLMSQPRGDEFRHAIWRGKEEAPVPVRLRLEEQGVGARPTGATLRPRNSKAPERDVASEVVELLREPVQFDAALVVPV